MEHYTVRVCAAILRPGDEVLVVRESERGLERLSLPGGVAHFKESLERAVAREVKEETGYEINPTEIAFLAESDDGRWSESQLDICFYAQIERHSPPPDRPGEQILGVEWRSIHDPQLRRFIPQAALFASSKRGCYVDSTSGGRRKKAGRTKAGRP